MTTLANKAILLGADNRPPMLEKDMYDSWKSRMKLYMMNRQHGRMILESFENGPLLWPITKENRVTRPKKYSKLSAMEAIQSDCDVKATNIIIQMSMHYECIRYGQSCYGFYCNFYCNSCICPRCGMNLFNETCDNCIYGDGKPITCNECEGVLRGGFCLPCNLKAENSFICDQNAYSFNDTSNNSNYLPQPQYENYLCNLYGNNSHDGYDCQQQFMFVYEQESSYNQNYNDNYYPHDLPSFPCCDKCGGSHETFQCQPMDQNVDFSSSDQIHTPQYLEVHPPSQKISNEVFHAKEDLMKSIQTFLEEFNCIPFEEKATILLQAWFKFFAIKHDQPEDSNELFQKLLEDLKELAEYKESLENYSKEIATLNSNQEKEEPPQDSDIHQLIREERYVEVCEEQKQIMENTILEMVEICRQKELLCMHDNVDDLIESALNSKLLLINSQRLDNKEQEVKNVVEQPAQRGNHIAPILSTKEPEYSPSMGYEHSNTTPKMESDEIIKSGVEVLVPILSENEVTLEDKRECDLPVYENSPICDDHSEIFSDSKNDDDISSNDDDFEDIEYVEASLSDPKIVSVEEENVVQQEEEEVDLEDISQIQDVVLQSNNSLSDNFSPEFETFCDHTEETRSGNTTTHANDSLPEYDSFCFEIEPNQERLINVVKNEISDDSTNDPLLEEADLFLASDNLIPPGIESFVDDSERDIRFLEELLIDDSIPFPINEKSNFDNPSVPLPPPEPPDFKSDTGEEISVVMNDKDKFDDDYSSFMIVKVFSLLSAESEDTVFDLGFTPH
uniref:Integrase, catalytic region, zinc finger, CCHC-type, peptidase aspartic, catalytic n=1 Tax=Tanacetum cinerariifolium TaxID=118510 RepID=A0A6L2MDW5_TANCI|nr:hypothetical protein [Tanacetum cinerariifolium]